MGRLVEHDATGPLKLDESDVDPEKGDIAVCLCGLSEQYPFCDGSHRGTRDEDADTWYRYVEEGSGDGDRPRRVVERIEFADGTVESFVDTARTE